MSSNRGNEKIKKENRKALKIFIPMVLGAGLVGGLFGYFSMTNGFQSLFDGIGNFMERAVYRITPYMVILSELVSFSAGIVCYNRGKKAFSGYEELAEHAASDEDEEKLEEIFENTDRFISIGMIFMNLGMIVSYMFFGIFMVNIIPIIEDGKFLLVILTILAFIAGMFAALRLEQLSVDFVKRMNPKMEGSVYDLQFRKKWETSCDEAEKMMIYKAGYKGFQTGNLTCVGLWVVLSLGSTVMDFGIMPVVSVSAVWFVMTASYYIESYRLERGRKEKS